MTTIYVGQIALISSIVLGKAFSPKIYQIVSETASSYRVSEVTASGKPTLVEKDGEIVVAITKNIRKTQVLAIVEDVKTAREYLERSEAIFKEYTDAKEKFNSFMRELKRGREL